MFDAQRSRLLMMMEEEEEEVVVVVVELEIGHQAENKKIAAPHRIR
jgi:hypothetical protein